MNGTAAAVLVLASLGVSTWAAAGGIEQKRQADGAVIFSNMRDAPPVAESQRRRVDAAAPAAPPRRPFAATVARISGHYGVDENLVHAVIAVESAYDPAAVSTRGAVGLMQLMPTTAAALGVADSTDPFENIRGGVRYLSGLLDKYDGDINLALAAYNAGTGAVQRHGGVPPYRETIEYIRRVRSRYHPGQHRGAAGGAQTIYTFVDEQGTVVLTQYPGRAASQAEPPVAQR